MSAEIACKQNILVTDFHLLKLLLVVFGFGFRLSSVNSADKTFAVCALQTISLCSSYMYHSIILLFTVLGIYNFVVFVD